MSKAIALGKPGYNVLTESDPKNYDFHSDYDTLKYYASGVSTLTISGTSVYGTVTHNLGYKPFYIVYNDIATSYSQCPFFFADGSFALVAGAYVNGTSLIFRVSATEAPPSPINYNFAYKIFKNNTGI